MANYTTITSDKSKDTALLCCLLGGWIGAHYYYVGRFGMGLLYTFTLGFGLLGWFIDVIRIATGGFRDNVGAPLRQ